MLYIEPILKAPGAPRFGYADDLLLLYTGRNLSKCIAKLEREYYRLMELGESIGSPFNPEKTEVQFFIRKQLDLPFS